MNRESKERTLPTAASFLRLCLRLGLFPETLQILVDLFLIAVLLREHTPAVFLHVESQFPGLLVAGTEIGAEIPVQELHTVLLRKRLILAA